MCSPLCRQDNVGYSCLLPCFAAAAQMASTLRYFFPTLPDPGSLPRFLRCGVSMQPNAPSLTLNILALCDTPCKFQGVTAGKYCSGIAVASLQSCETTISFLLPLKATSSALLGPLFHLLGRLHLSSFWMKIKIISSYLLNTCTK